MFLSVLSMILFFNFIFPPQQLFSSRQILSQVRAFALTEILFAILFNSYAICADQKVMKTDKLSVLQTCLIDNGFRKYKITTGSKKGPAGSSIQRSHPRDES